MYINIKFQFFLLNLIFIPFAIVQPVEVIRGVRYLKQNGNLSEISDLNINRGYIERIIDSKQKENIRFVIPSFCDAYVTLGADGTGGQNQLPKIKTALRSFLHHGFTHIQSIGDGPWIHSIKSDIDSGKIIGPKITIANKPFIPQSKEVKDVSNLLYFIAESKSSMFEELEKQIYKSNHSIHIFNRFNEDEKFSFDSGLLNRIGNIAKEKKRFITIHTFADRIAILDALISGNRYLSHPILFEMKNEIAKQHLEELHLIPLLNVYRNLHLTDSPDGEGVNELNFLRRKSNFFQEHYAALFESYLKLEIDEISIENRKTEYDSFLKFIKKNEILANKIILGSGAGNRLSFPGISGIQELKILAKIIKRPESILKIPSQNSCSYLGESYKGIIAVGQEANFLILIENPLKKLDSLFQIDEVFKFGTSMNLIPKTKKTGKRRR